MIHKAGTLGEVYKAQDLDLERVVALKVIREGKPVEIEVTLDEER